MLISFITTIKVAEYYEWILDSIIFYIKNIEHFCSQLDISYEIIICEQINEMNIFKIREKYDFSQHINVKIIELEQNYPNPFKYNLLDTYGKNKGLHIAKGKYACITNGDIMFDESFFNFIKSQLCEKVFYRFATYELPKPCFYTFDSIEPVLRYCKAYENKRLCNPGCFAENLNLMGLAQKSGDIMLLDTNSFKEIKGYPENVFTEHMDLATCAVCASNFNVCIPSKEVCIYTFERLRSDALNKPKLYTVQEMSLIIALSYVKQKTSNYTGFNDQHLIYQSENLE